MKPHILILTIFIASFTSCLTGLYEDNDYPYYKIEGTDFDYIPTTYKELGKVITFKNQNNDIVRFEAEHYRIKKNFRGNFGKSAPAHYYDELRIWLSLLDIEGNDIHRCRYIGINIRKFEFVNSTEKGKGLNHTINLPSLDGETCQGESEGFSTPGFKHPLKNYNVETMKINNITYDKVLTFEPYHYHYYTFYDNSTIDKVYYDVKHGFIGFDDTKNNLQYRIVN